MSDYDDYQEPIDDVPVRDVNDDIVTLDESDDLHSRADVVPLDLVNGAIAEPYAYELDYQEAKTLTDQIRATTDVLYVLIQRAHAGKAWKALGYSNFGEYVNSEFNISRSRAYQLINQANVIEQISAATPEGTQININESTAREIKSLVDGLVPDIKEATEGLAPEEASEVVKKMLDEARESDNEISADDFDAMNFFDGSGESYGEELAGDQADRAGFSSSGYGGGGGNGGSFGEPRVADAFEGMFGSDDELPELAGQSGEGRGFELEEDAQTVRRKLESIYDFFLALQTIQNMPEPEQLIEWIPADRKIQVQSSLPLFVAWVNNFAEEWGKNYSDDSTGEEANDANEEVAAEFDEFKSEDTDIFADIN